MRSAQTRFWKAGVVSLIIHGVFVGVFCAFLPDSPPSPRPVTRPINLIIDSPDEITISSAQLDELPRDVLPKKEPQSLAKEPANRNAAKEGLPVSVAVANGIAAAISRSEMSPLNQTSVTPLHGMLNPGQSVVYVLDCSGSMGQHRKLSHAISVLKQSLKMLKPEARFQIVTYDSRATVMRLSEGFGLSPASSTNLREAECRLDELSGEGSSRHAEGLRAGLALHPSLLILLTDADELSPKDSLALKKWNTSGTSIHAVIIGTSGRERDSSLRELTGERGTHFISLPDSSPLMP